jgi:type II restriction/modification system DNA methylase subunit YeeA
MDWDSVETSWDFKIPWSTSGAGATLQERHRAVDAEQRDRFTRTKTLEEQNNRLFVEAYALQGDLSPEVADAQITLYHSDREEDTKRLVSYGIGCVMGRYSLDKPGLIYAQSGNADFDPSHYKTFPADDDGIIPLLETDWGIRDDATDRFVEFVGVAWPRETLDENVKFIADCLGPAKNEQPRETIRRYLATVFYKDHLRWYKRRPIYWLFSSGKQRTFQCLVYLHRYHEGTLARMRTEYVIPLQGKITGRIEQLNGDIAKATSTSHRRKLQKEQDDLKKQQAELVSFDEKLKHYADMRINLDLDEGVKVNYGKFGDLLAEVKAVTGGSEE